MTLSPADWPLPQVRDWARARHASFDIDARTEMVKGVGLRHTGLSVEIFAEPDRSLLEEGGAAACADLWERLQALAFSVVDPMADVRAELEPYDASAHLRAENRFTPEVQLRLLLTPRLSTGASSSEWTRTARARLEHALRERGLAAKAWAGDRSA